MRKAMWWILLCVCVLRSAWGDEHVKSIVVKTKQGSFRGYKPPEGDLFVFYGVPYATAPTGSQRFQPPLPPPIRSYIYEAVDRSIVCPQFYYPGLELSRNTKEKEDCLVANLYVPDTKDRNLPVIVYIHGGGFITGFGDFVTPKHLAMTKKAIIINFNYRLGAHGFLCLGTKDVPGNAGLKDQVALLRWIKDNIAGFGGNPDDVTLAGYSVGSSSVELLMLSKMANGLFNKVILESGSSLAPFSFQVDPTEIAKTHAKLLNFTDVDNISALEEFYKTLPYDLLTSINVIDAINGTYTFTPCIERDIGSERFLDDSPVNIIKRGNYQKRPMLYGFATMDGNLRLGLFGTWKDMMNSQFSDFVPANLQFQSEDEKEEVAASIRNFYFGSKPVNGDTIMGYIDFFTDTMFVHSILLSVRLHIEAGNNQIYLYEYSYTDESSPIIPYIGIRGTEHFAQTWAIHDGLNITHSDESIATDACKNMKRYIREMWLNFVTTGKPVPDGSSLPLWPPTGPNTSPYMLLDQIPELKSTPPLEKRMRFWDEIYSKHYRQPVPPKTPRVLESEL